MQTATLGRTGLQVSRIAFGTWQLGGEWGVFDEDAAIGAIRHARDLGVNFFDTAQAYGFGRSEGVLGRALADELKRDRDALVIATKGGVNPGAERSRDASRDFLRSGVEQSLRALGIDHIDLYQVHWPDEQTPAEETAEALQELVDEGKIRHVGVSNYDVAHMTEFEHTRPVETLQPPYHLFRRGIEQEVLPYTRQHNIGVLVYSPLASGLLTGTMNAETTFAEDDWRAHSSAFRGETLRRNLAVVEQLSEFAALRGITVGQLAIAWTLAQPGVHAAIVGARSSRNIEDSLTAADVRLSDDDLAEIERITAEGVSIEGATPEGVV
ncbi:aryl-alcohol dehydrogenase-like predicted oxidoreductase [Halopolyspora algeriensis]|uniref:Aryl-alcohol dehydrogenase-like predicted oxidoreductase n=1 Tax=Halopolyspora algeriensis TaxID=1500506 RepID=A0A368VXA0_9ACTN|nr:aldo/keto reductase [Halopolyspora algeriensis]RCW45937.1 aryl-alcohol dehydrogenase-like predicted oxidoreductase [Halopolyspora algeriensis]TQM55350.1 aryl-alcohol dehydrogenase-like predicted oxidoreductase [Halopolyspora algeriensis]